MLESPCLKVFKNRREALAGVAQCTECQPESPRNRRDTCLSCCGSGCESAVSHIVYCSSPHRDCLLTIYLEVVGREGARSR